MSENLREASSLSLDDWDYPGLSQLNRLLFCERRCVLAGVEMIWAENQYTIEGTAMHKKVHGKSAEEKLEIKNDESVHESGRVSRNLSLVSHRLKLVGKADLVEFRPEPYPIEYKRGRKKKWDNDDVQLCAQALCLEEMLGVEVRAGAVFHILSHRRREVEFTPDLRQKTENAAKRLHELLGSKQAPPPILKPRCRGCSIKDFCMPEVGSEPAKAKAYMNRLRQIESEDVLFSEERAKTSTTRKKGKR